MIVLRYAYRFSLILIILLSVGCATQTRPVGDLVSEVKTHRFTGSEKSLTINNVLGGEVSKQSAWVVNTPKIDNQSFRKLLLGSMEKSGLFSDVIDQSRADYSLDAEIIFQEMTTGGLTNTLMLLVKYELVENKSGNIILKENLYTQSELSASDVFAGNIRIVRLLEQGLILNMNSLLRKIGPKIQ